MIKSFTINNFRGFGDLAIEGLERVNLIAGMNNIGKTALLESLWLQMGPHNPELALRLNVWRGIEHFDLDPSELWGWLFHNKNIDADIKFKNWDDDGNERTLRILLEEPKEVVKPDKQLLAGELTTAGRSLDLVFEYNSPEFKTTARAIIEAEGIRFNRAKIQPPQSGVFLQARWGATDDVKRFSSLSRKNKTSDVMKALKFIEPRLKGLHIQVTGPTAIIYCDIEGFSEQVPLQYMGAGMGRLLSVISAIVSTPNGVICIDEIDNGLGYSVMTDFWRVIAQVARNTPAQVFATTHSWECIQSAHRAFASSELYDFRLFRLDRIDNSIQATAYDQETLEHALSTDREVR